MNSKELAACYAKTIFSLAASNEELKRHLYVLEVVADLLRKQSLIRQFFASLQISEKQKESVLKTSIEAQVDPLLMRTFALLLKKNLFMHVPEIAKKYRHLVFKKLGIVEVHLITASALDAKQRAWFINKLQNDLQKTVLLDEKIDPQLIGGGFLTFENKLLDFSIKEKIRKLEHYLQDKEHYGIAT